MAPPELPQFASGGTVPAARDGTESLIVRSDGAEWVLDGRNNNTYHIWDLHGPEASGATAAYREFCLYLVQLSGLKVRQDEIY